MRESLNSPGSFRGIYSDHHFDKTRTDETSGQYKIEFHDMMKQSLKSRRIYMSDVVIADVKENGVASLTLNRPKALNSLSYEMISIISEKLTKWQTDEEVKLIVLKGEGAKGFCAGGDIKTLYEAQSSEIAFERACHFFELEYMLDLFIYEYKKPIIALTDGIVMGGGVGLSNGTSHRIVTERTKWAMPEMNIGFFPDVGAAYFLNKAPGHVGAYLALTGSVITGADVMFIQAGDDYMNSEELSEFLKELEETEWSDVESQLHHHIKKYAKTPAESSQLQKLEEQINTHFRYDTVEEIVSSLEKDSGEFAISTLNTLMSKSPVSLKVALKQLRDGKEKTVRECFETDYVLALNFLKHCDFYEGIRSVLIDKDRDPQYRYKKLDEVSDQLVNQFFTL